MSLINVIRNRVAQAVQRQPVPQQDITALVNNAQDISRSRSPSDIAGSVYNTANAAEDLLFTAFPILQKGKSDIINVGVPTGIAIATNHYAPGLSHAVSNVGHDLAQLAASGSHVWGSQALAGLGGSLAAQFALGKTIQSLPTGGMNVIQKVRNQTRALPTVQSDVQVLPDGYAQSVTYDSGPTQELQYLPASSSRSQYFPLIAGGAGLLLGAALLNSALNDSQSPPQNSPQSFYMDPMMDPFV